MQIALETLRDHHGASFVQESAAPEVNKSSGGTKIDRSGLLDIIDSNSSLTRAELQVQKSEGRHQKITQENKLNRVSSLPHSVVLFLYAQGRTSLLTSVSIMCTGSHLVYVHKVVLIVRTQARVNLLTELSL